MGWGGLRGVFHKSTNQLIADRAPSRGRLWLLAVAGLILGMLGVQPDPQQARKESAPATYPIAADADAERTHASQNFTVTWIHDSASPDAPGLRDKDGSGVPDSMEKVLSAFEAARTFMLGELGYRPPPVNGPLRIYIANRGEEATAKRLPGGQGLSRPSFIVLPSEAARRPLPRSLRVLAVHEYFHAIQIGYDADYEHWIGEASATWVEDVFDDGYDSNHGVLKDFVPLPRSGLTGVSGQHEYGAFLFVQFLVERYGRGNPALVRELWEQMAVPEAGGAGLGAMAAVKAIVERRGSTLSQAFAEFHLWRWDLERFEEGEAYRKAVGGQWPAGLQNVQVATESCRLSSDAGSGLAPLSGDYAVFRPHDKPQTAKAILTLEGPSGATGFVLAQKQDGREKVKYLPLGGEGRGLISTGVRFGDDQVRRVILGVANPATTGQPARFAYSLRLEGRTAVTAEPVDPPVAIDYPLSTMLRGRVLCDGQPVIEADVTLVETSRSGEQQTFPAVTGAGGLWGRLVDPDQTSTYEVRVVDPLLSPSSSQPWEVGVRVALDLEIPDAEVSRGQPVEVQGRMGPPHPGALLRIDYRRPDLGWREGPQVQPDADGDYRVSLTLPDAGIWQLRAVVISTGDEDHLPFTTLHEAFVSVGDS